MNIYLHSYGSAIRYICHSPSGITNHQIYQTPTLTPTCCLVVLLTCCLIVSNPIRQAFRATLFTPAYILSSLTGLILRFSDSQFLRFSVSQISKNSLILSCASSLILSCAISCAVISKTPLYGLLIPPTFLMRCLQSLMASGEAFKKSSI